jgi:hypothetical protein
MIYFKLLSHVLDIFIGWGKASRFFFYSHQEMKPLISSEGLTGNACNSGPKENKSLRIKDLQVVL